MRKKFAINLLFLFAVNLLVKPFWIFGIDRVVQNKTGPAVFGTYFAVFNYSFLLSIILDLGITNFNNRAISRDKKRLGEYLVNLMMVKFFLSLIYFALTFVAAMAIGYEGQKMRMLFFLAVNQILLSAILYFRSNIAALQLFKTDSLISILDRLLAIIFCLILIYAKEYKDSFNIIWFIYAQTAALFITAVVSFAIVAGRAVISLNFWKTKFTRLILLKSAPFAMLALLMGIYYRIDAVMIERMLPNGAKEAGIYAAPFRLLDAVNQFGYLFATLLLPMFAGMIRKNESIKNLVKFSSELMFAGSVMIGLSCYFFSAGMMQLLYPNSNAYWWKIFGWLMLNFIPIGSIYIFGTLLTARGSLKTLNMISLAGMVINVGLNLIMIPRYGAFGATIATLITQLIAAAAHIVASNRQFGFTYEVMDLLKLTMFPFLCCAVMILVKMLPYNWMIDLAVALTISSVIAMAIKIIPVAELAAFVRSRAAS
jgi:O-antigen/teichoic acid export membrane protein